MKINNEIVNQLLKFGIKPSVQRITIMEYLTQHMTHPTADVIFNDLYTSIPTLSKTTVYNTLKLFEEHGAIRTINIDDKNQRYDADISNHAHFKCKNCGFVNDFPLKNVSIFESMNFDDFVLTECQVYYKGYCKECKDVFIQNKN